MYENPFLTPRIDQLTRWTVFNTDRLTADIVENTFGSIEKATSDPVKAKEIGAVKNAFLGIAAHEEAEEAYEAFTAELAHHERPENLSRAEIRDLFEKSRYGKSLLKHEQTAIAHFSSALEQDKNFSASTSENTGFDAIDIKTYLIDIQNRIAERIANPEERKARLEELDDELVELIKAVPEDGWGKRLELQEIYLLRRLIHRADTGHLAHVSHGTLRQDLRADMGSVDMRLTAAGDIYDFQVKTFKSNASDESRAKQYDIIAKTKLRAEQSGTHFAMLETNRVQNAYDRSQRQKTTEKQTVGDKFSALEPLTNDLNPHERARLLKLVGLTEETLAKEQADLERGQEIINKQLREIRETETPKLEKRKKERAQFEQEKAEEEARNKAAAQAILDKIDKDRSNSEAKRRAEAEEIRRNEEVRRAKRDREKALLKDAEDARAAAKAAQEKKAKTKETKPQAEAKAKWIKARSAELMNIPALVKAGFLTEENKMVSEDIKAAKAAAEKRYTKKYILDHFPFTVSPE